MDRHSHGVNIFQRYPIDTSKVGAVEFVYALPHPLTRMPLGNEGHSFESDKGVEFDVPAYATMSSSHFPVRAVWLPKSVSRHLSKIRVQNQGNEPG